MAIIYHFPSKDERQWAGVYEAITMLLTYLGATLDEIDKLQSCLRERWEALGKPFDVQLPYHIVGALTEEQHEVFCNALRAQATEIAQHFKNEHSATLLEFVKLEFEIVRLKRIE